MKIKVGEKGEEAAKEVLLEAFLEKQHQLQQQSDPEHSGSGSFCKRPAYGWCGGWWLTGVFVLAVLFLCQMWVMFYLLYGQEPVVTPAAHFTYWNSQGQLMHVKFSWSNCGNSSDPAKLSKLVVSPDPVLINRNITLTLESYLGVDVHAPVSMVLEVKTKFFGIWCKVPCLDNMGSCHYSDVCKLSPFPAPDICPDPFPRFKIPCRCPVQKGVYDVNAGEFSIPEKIQNLVPSWLVTGDYNIEGTAYMEGKRLGCYQMYVSVSYADTAV